MSGQGEMGTVTDRSRTQVGGARGGLSLIGPGPKWAGQGGSVTDRSRSQVGGAKGQSLIGGRVMNREW